MAKQLAITTRVGIMVDGKPYLDVSKLPESVRTQETVAFSGEKGKAVPYSVTQYESLSEIKGDDAVKALKALNAQLVLAGHGEHRALIVEKYGVAEVKTTKTRAAKGGI